MGGVGARSGKQSKSTCGCVWGKCRRGSEAAIYFLECLPNLFYCTFLFLYPLVPAYGGTNYSSCSHSAEAKRMLFHTYSESRRNLCFAI